MLQRTHRINALLLSIFISVHLINHLTIIGGVETHLAVMKILRVFYRPLAVETMLYFLFGSQIIIGFIMTFKRGYPNTQWVWAQYISGIILAFFLLQHLGAALLTRVFNPEIDTNVYWAAAVVSREPFVWYFAPYYTLGILSLFVHVAAALGKRTQFKAYSNWIVAAGVLVAVIVIPSLMGWYAGPIDLPMEHMQYIKGFSI